MNQSPRRPMGTAQPSKSPNGVPRRPTSALPNRPLQHRPAGTIAPVRPLPTPLPKENVPVIRRPPRSKEAEVRRRAEARRQAERRAAERRRKRIRFICTVCMGAVVLMLFALSLRSCVNNKSVPASIPETTPFVEEIPSIETTTLPPADSEPDIPTVIRPTPCAATVKLTDEIDSTYAVLVSLTDNRILAEKSANAKIHPASLTKVMSMIVAYEHIGNLSDTVTVTSTLIDPLYKAEASLAGFAPGETVTLLDLLYGMILPSGAEATVALAEYVAGSEDAFVSLMNEKAAELGLTKTHFTNATGLHDKEHHSTAIEMAMILTYAMQYEDCAMILSTYRHTTAPTEKHPEGLLLESTMFSRMYGDEPDGVTILAGKTGYTHEAHHCLMSYAEDDVTGDAYVFVSIDSTEKFGPVFDAINVYSDYTNAIDKETGERVFLP